MSSLPELARHKLHCLPRLLASNNYTNEQIKQTSMRKQITHAILAQNENLSIGHVRLRSTNFVKRVFMIQMSEGVGGNRLRTAALLSVPYLLFALPLGLLPSLMIR